MAISVVTLKTGDRVISELKEIFEGEEDEDLPSTASEWVFKTKSGNLASVVDLSFGVGLEILK